jgi:hypothetical protein
VRRRFLDLARSQSVYREKFMLAAAAMVLAAFLLPLAAPAASVDVKERTKPITSPASVDGKEPAKPYLVRHDYRAVRFEQAPGPGLREDLITEKETWNNVKFGPMRIRRDGVREIFVSAHRSQWLPASELPECVRERFGIK